MELAKLFDIELYERKEGNKYKAVLLVGMYARYLISKSSKTPLGVNPVLLAAKRFVERGIEYTTVEGESSRRGNG